MTHEQREQAVIEKATAILGDLFPAKEQPCETCKGAGIVFEYGAMIGRPVELPANDWRSTACPTCRPDVHAVLNPPARAR